MIISSSLLLLSSLFILSHSATQESKGPTLAYKIAIGLLDSTHHNGSNIRVVDDPSKPILIEDTSYFWDDQYFPSQNESRCVQFETANSRGNVSICDTRKQIKCSNTIDEIAADLQNKIEFPDGTNPSQIAWFCPQSNSCCEFKCCAPFSTIFIIIIICVAVAILAPILFQIYRISSGKRNEEMETERQEETRA
ncbi:hypothetical protein PFISCL1PPCAC_15179 [Pristionchus fissidentatus]|uniref:CX domain-containing protein n=1 Tax=Pristionchus fissidentatus TaxID=1538716 RepID=A0AAV5VYS2_9BILA|nr:hypothetical protein PFISCL1PPCAC_15179 [Pristionchus fissidentatus]